ncbi:hypothetical protein D3C80_2162360 [compost metagenome]
MPKPFQAFLGFVQPAAEQQRLGAQVNQARAAVQQLRFDAFAPVHEAVQVPFAQDPAQP